jgi:hypothetical protein
METNAEHFGRGASTPVTTLCCLVCAMRRSSKTDNTYFKTRVRHVTHILHRIITFTRCSAVSNSLCRLFLGLSATNLSKRQVSVFVMCALCKILGGEIDFCEYYQSCMCISGNVCPLASIKGAFVLYMCT